MDLFYKAKKQIIFSTPNITDEVASAIVQVKSMGELSVHIYLEFSENIYRAGFGDINAITILKKANIEFNNKEGLNIYFLIIDDFGYFYFPKSRFHELEGMAYDLFPMDRMQIKAIKLL